MEIFIFIFPCIFVLAVAAVFLIVRLASGGLTQASGWNTLAQYYPVNAEPVGQRFIWQNIRVGRVRFRFCTTIIVSPQGLYLAPRPPAMPVPPPIFIPWTDMKAIRPTTIYWARAVAIKVGDPVIGEIALQMNIYNAIRPYLPSGVGVI